MELKTLILTLILVLAACSGPAQDAEPGPVVEQPEESVEQPEAATQTPELLQPTEAQEAVVGGGPVQADTADAEEWHLVASYQYIGSSTPTDMLYTWEAWFTVAPDGTLRSLDHYGWGEGMAGLNYNGECVEAQPANMDWNFDFSGKLTSMEQAFVEETYGEVSAEIRQDGKVEMFEFTFANPDVFEYVISPFSCAPNLDEAFLKSLGTYWVTTVPIMSPEFRTVPAEAGMFCQPVLSFEEEGLGTLVPCYLLEK
ncbi:MAG TPA: hypothetical protein DCY42_09105 [Chloroflexi bacterium]|nr:hypothetical protein [Chloroflexota bacterium]